MIVKLIFFTSGTFGLMAVEKAHLRLLMDSICEYRVILRCLHICLILHRFLIIRPTENVLDIPEQIKRPTFTGAPKSLHICRKGFGHFSYIEYHQNLIDSSMHFEDQI